VIPPFQTASNPNFNGLGAPIDHPDFPFDDLFDDGSYNARAYNDEPGIVDTNGILTVRALGTVRGEQKLLQANLRAISGLDLINCEGAASDTCPDTVSGDPIVDPVEGREPQSHPDLPQLEFPLDNVNNFYRFDLHPTNFASYSPGPPLTVFACGAGIDCSSPSSINLDVVDNSFYFIDQPNTTVKIASAAPRSRVVIYSLGDDPATVPVEGQVIMEGNHEYTDMIIIGQGEIQLKDGTIHAPLPMPVVISEGDVTHGNATLQVFGTIYAVDPNPPPPFPNPPPFGLVNLNPVSVHGVIIGDIVETQGASSTLFTDDHSTDTTYLKYYAFMPGFVYPDELKTTVVDGGSWREIE